MSEVESQAQETESEGKKAHDHFFYPKDPSKRTNLLVNYLPAGMNESEFREFFAVIGPIDCIRFEKKGYGFVKYSAHEDALRAIDKFNGLIISGKKLSIKWARAGGSRAKSNLFVSGLPPNWGTEELKTAFEEFGQIIEVRVLKADGGQSLRRGFVRFNTVEESTRAIKHRNGWLVPGTYHILKVQVSARKNGVKRNKHIRKYGADGVCRTVYILPEVHTSPEVRGAQTERRRSMDYERSRYYPRQHYPPAPFTNKTFRIESTPYHMQSSHQFPYPPYSHPGSHQLPPHRPENSYTSYAPENPPYSSESSQYSTENPPYPASLHPNYRRDPSNIPLFDTPRNHSRPVYRSPKQPEKEMSNRVFISNLPTFFTEFATANLASAHGTVKDVDIQTDNKGNNIGCVIVTFETEVQALNACRYLHKSMILNRELTALIQNDNLYPK